MVKTADFEFENVRSSLAFRQNCFSFCMFYGGGCMRYVFLLSFCICFLSLQAVIS